MFPQRPPLNTAIKGFAQNLRRQSTPHERRLWSQLRGRRFVDFKFRRQVPIGRYIADFVCYEARVIVELDGSQHADSKRDVARDAELERRGFKVLRVWNGQVLAEEEAVLESILLALRERSGHEVGGRTDERDEE